MSEYRRTKNTFNRSITAQIGRKEDKKKRQGTAEKLTKETEEDKKETQKLGGI